MNVCSVSMFSRQNELKGKVYHKEQSSLSTTGGHSVRAVVNWHVVNMRCRLQCAMNNS